MGCGTGTMRIILFICNTIVWLIGVALFATGLYLFLSGKNYEKLVDGSVFSASIIIIVVGFLIALIGFLGCFGAAKKSGGMLLLYGILLLIIITIQILGGVVSFVFSKQVSEFVKEGLELSLASYGGSNETHKAFTSGVDYVQEHLECCGMYGYQDYRNVSAATYWTTVMAKSKDVPDTCCKVQSTDCGKGLFTNSTTEGIYTVGCLEHLKDTVQENLQIMGYCALVFIVVELINFAAALLLRNRYKKH